MKRLYLFLCTILLISLFAGVTPAFAAETRYTAAG